MPDSAENFMDRLATGASKAAERAIKRLAENEFVFPRSVVDALFTPTIIPQN